MSASFFTISSNFSLRVFHFGGFSFGGFSFLRKISADARSFKSEDQRIYVLGHPFHIVQYSPWPFLLSVSILGNVFSLMLWMFYILPFYNVIFSFLMSLVMLSFWLQDLHHEYEYQGQMTKKVKSALRIGMVLFISSEVWFFVSFFWAYFHNALNPSIFIGGVWPPFGIIPFLDDAEGLAAQIRMNLLNPALDPWDFVKLDPDLNTRLGKRNMFLFDRYYIQNRMIREYSQLSRLDNPLTPWHHPAALEHNYWKWVFADMTNVGFSIETINPLWDARVTRSYMEDTYSSTLFKSVIPTEHIQASYVDWASTHVIYLTTGLWLPIFEVLSYSSPVGHSQFKQGIHLWDFGINPWMSDNLLELFSSEGLERPPFYALVDTSMHLWWTTYESALLSVALDEFFSHFAEDEVSPLQSIPCVWSRLAEEKRTWDVYFNFFGTEILNDSTDCKFSPGLRDIGNLDHMTHMHIAFALEVHELPMLLVSSGTEAWNEYFKLYDLVMGVSKPRQFKVDDYYLHQEVFPSVWKPFGIPFAMTIMLITSGITLTTSHLCLRVKHRRMKLSLVLVLLQNTLIYSVCFLLLQAIEYVNSPFSINDSIFGSVFFMATGFHGFHVIVGTVFLFVCYMRIQRGYVTRDTHVSYECAIWYWHFVDVVWIFLFISVYWWAEPEPLVIWFLF